MEVAAAAPVSANLPTTRIRVDNNLDRAIIEVRSSDSGQVIRQYPTEAQIRAFARAEALKQSHQHEETREQVSKLEHTEHAAAPKAAPTPAPAPANLGTDNGGTAGAVANATQSIDV